MEFLHPAEKCNKRVAAGESDPGGEDCTRWARESHHVGRVVATGKSELQTLAWQWNQRFDGGTGTARTLDKLSQRAPTRRRIPAMLRDRGGGS
jgi:hypothetical protein